MTHFLQTPPILDPGHTAHRFVTYELRLSGAEIGSDRFGENALKRTTQPNANCVRRMFDNGA